MADSPPIGRWLGNPLFQREVQQIARRRLTFTLRWIYGALLGLTLWRFSGTFPGDLSLQASDYAGLGRALFENIYYFQMAYVTLVALVSGSDLIRRERRADTLGLLTLTSLGQDQVARGKWLAALVQPASMVLCSAPVLASCAFLGGIDAGDVAQAVALPLASAGLAAAYSILAAVYWSSAIASFLVGLSMYFVHFILGLTIDLSVLPLPPAVAYALHPWLPLAERNPGRVTWEWVSSFFVAWPCCLLLLKAAAARLRDPESFLPRPVEVAQHLESRRSYAQAAAQNLGFIWRDRPVSESHPLLWKEIRTRPLAHVACEIRLFVLILLGLGTLAAAVDRGFIFVPYGLGFLVCLLAIPAGAALFARDREERRWETLLTAPIRARDLVGAKLLSGPLSPEGKTLLVEAGLSVLILMSGSEAQGVVKGAIALALFAGVTYAFSGAAALLTGGFRSALALGIAASLAVLVGIPWLDGLLLSEEPTFYRSPFERPSLTRILHPLAQGYTGESRNFAAYCAIYLLLLCGLFLWMSQSLDRRESRGSSRGLDSTRPAGAALSLPEGAEPDRPLKS